MRRDRHLCTVWARLRLDGDMITVVAVWAMAFGVSPGVALVAGALTLLVLDRFDPNLITRLLGR